MTQRLILKLGESLADPINWAVTETRADGVEIVSTGAVETAAALNEIPGAAANNPALALVPAEQVIYRRLPSPPRQAKKLMAAAALALEDTICQPVDELHIAVNRHDDSAEIAGISDHLMQQWRDAFEAAGLKVTILTSDAAVLAASSDAAILFQDGDRVIITAPTVQAAAEFGLIHSAGASLADSFGEVDAQAYGDLAAAGLSHVPNLSLEGDASDTVFFQLASNGLKKGAPTNLLQGAYAEQRDWLLTLGQWRAPTLAAASLFAFFCAVQITDALRVDRAADAWKARVTALHETAFPDKIDVDPVSNARMVVGAGNSGDDFVSLLEPVAEALGANEPVALDRIGFNGAQSELQITVRTKDNAAIERLIETLKQGGLSVQYNGGRRTRGDWVGEIMVGR
ncbi:MAG: type II secretion system protein GspL [Pseudomonadota bacterium]